MWDGPEENEKRNEWTRHMFLWMNSWILVTHWIWEIGRKVAPEVLSLFDRKNGYILTKTGK